MTAYELSGKMAKIHRAIDAIYALKLMEGVHSLDMDVLHKAGMELIRAAHDTAREFEQLCFRRGENNANQLASR